MNVLQRSAGRLATGLLGVTMVVIVASVGIGGVWSIGLNRPVPAVVVGDAAPEFVLPLVDEAGMAVGSRNLRGHPVLLAFWQRDCMECADTLRSANELQREMGRAGLATLAVSTDDFVPMLESRDAAAALAPDVMRVHDWQARLHRQFDGEPLPRWVVIDRSGRILAMATTTLPDRAAVLRALQG